MTAKELKELREALCFSQTKLGKNLGVSLRAVQHWEYGERKIPKIAEKFLLHLYGNRIEQKRKQDSAQAESEAETG